MKKLKKGDIVTPKKSTLQFSRKRQYQVIEYYPNDSILLCDDQFKYTVVSTDDFDNITVYPIFERLANFVSKLLRL